MTFYDDQQVLKKKPPPLNPTLAACHMQETEVALQFSKSSAAETALQHSLFCSAEVIFAKSAALQQTKNCAATLKKLRCRKVAFSCRFPADFKPPR